MHAYPALTAHTLLTSCWLSLKLSLCRHTATQHSLIAGVTPNSEADATRHQLLAAHHSNSLDVVSLDDSATAEASHASREEQAGTAAEAERQAEIKRHLVALYDAHILAFLSECSAHESVPQQVTPQEQSCTAAGSSGGPGSASVVGHTSAAVPTGSTSQDAMPHAQSQALATDQAAAGNATLWVAACTESFGYWASGMLPVLFPILWLEAPILLSYCKPPVKTSSCASGHLPH